jgi:hypothetical protein
LIGLGFKASAHFHPLCKIFGKCWKFIASFQVFE